MSQGAQWKRFTTARQTGFRQVHSGADKLRQSTTTERRRLAEAAINASSESSGRDAMPDAALRYDFGTSVA